MDNEANQGKNLLLAIAGFILLFEIVLATSELRLGEPISSREITRVCLTLILFYLAFKGYRWPRILMAVFSWISVIVMGVLSLFMTPVWYGLINELSIVFVWSLSILISILFGVCAYLLTFSKKIQSFQEYQKGLMSNMPTR